MTPPPQPLISYPLLPHHCLPPCTFHSPFCSHSPVSSSPCRCYCEYSSSSPRNTPTPTQQGTKDEIFVSYPRPQQNHAMSVQARHYATYPGYASLGQCCRKPMQFQQIMPCQMGMDARGLPCSDPRIYPGSAHCQLGIKGRGWRVVLD